jgi:branched-chain amino acid transport system substrate-binding protein
MKSGVFAAVAACILLLAAPASAQGVKIDILNDRSGVYADYGGKYSVEKDTSEIVTHAGGKVIGSVRVPLNSSDFH